MPGVDSDQIEAFGGLVERQHEVESLQALLSDLEHGRGALALIEGLAGTGKSLLLRECCMEAKARSIRTLSAAGLPHEAGFVHGVVRQLFEGSPSAVPAKLGDGNPISYPALHALYRAIADFSAEGPLLIAVDDAEWADEPSLHFIRHLATRLDGLPVAVILTWCPAASQSDDHPLNALRRVAGATLLRPQPLTPKGVAQLARNGSRHAAGEDRVRLLHETTGGNPFLVSELVRAVGDGDEVPEAISLFVDEHLSRLPLGSSEFACGVAILEGHSQLGQVCDLLEMPTESAPPIADALESAGALRRRSDCSYEFVHAIVRKAVYRRIPEARRAALHRRAVHVLGAASLPAVQIAPHAVLADACGSEEVVDVLRAAANEAMETGSPRLAADYLSRALHEPPTAAQRPDVLADLGAANWLTGRDESAVRCLRESLAQTTEPASRAERARTLARAMFSTGDVSAAFVELGSVEEALGAPDGSLSAEAAGLGLISPDTAQEARAIQRHWELSGVNGCESLHRYSAAAVHEWMVGRASRARELCEKALGDGRLLHAEGPESPSVLQAASVLAFVEAPDFMDEVTSQMRAESERRGSVFGCIASRTLRGLGETMRGRVRAALTELHSASEWGDVPVVVQPLLAGLQAISLVRLGRLAEAEETILAVGDLAQLPTLVHTNLVFYARGRLRIAQGRPEDALEDFESLRRRIEECGVRNPSFSWRRGAVEANILMERLDAAQELARENLDDARRWGTPTAIGIGLHVLGLSKGPGGEGVLAEAVEELRRSPAAFDRARALFDLGLALRRSGHPAKSRKPLREAVDLARRCGASSLAELALSELLIAGARPRRQMFSGLGALTASERRIAQLAKAGLTNKQIAQRLFLATKTVENHLTRVYAKLEIPGREALPAALADALGSYET
jgi:DNA-binding CsgD family transcriptional regulator